MNILDEIVVYKRLEVARKKNEVPTAALEATPLFARERQSLKAAFKTNGRPGIISEFKRRSPSKGIINDRSDVVEVTGAYTKAGAIALSVLTDEKFFGGSANDLIAARVNNIPILRKDFIIDEYQLVEARSIGADIVLLIASCLSPREVTELAAAAKKLGLETLLEIHGENELQHFCNDIDFIGVNNRNLQTFEVSIDVSLALLEKLPGVPKITESGINSPATVTRLFEAGYDGFLIGENFMKAESPALAFKEFMDQLPHRK